MNVSSEPVLLKRKAYQKLLDWKETSNGSTAILVEGARRVGKSFLVESFAKNEYKSHIIIDFGKASPSIKDLFINDLDNMDQFFEKLKALTGVWNMPVRESVLVFDEVQRFPRAREAIKYLVADGRYDYIETGSLISIKENVGDIIVPSEEESVSLDPLDFEEYLEAVGKGRLHQFIVTSFRNREPMGEGMHREVMGEFRRYMLVGGMPQAVLKYIETGSYQDVDRVKRNILSLYRNDIMKFANGYKSRVKAIFETIPSQLNKKEKKFSITSITKNSRNRDYEDAFMWLDDGRIINQCFNSTDLSNGLNMSLDDSTHKCYMADTGLLVTLSISVNSVTEDDVYRSILVDRMNINEGMFMENIVAQELHSNGHELFFYSRWDRENRENNMEIDFLIAIGTDICPIEVKSSGKMNHVSLDKFCNKFGKRIGQAYLLGIKDLSVEEGFIRLPVYMAGLL